VAEPSRRYTFHPLEQRGVLIGLQAGQIATLLGGAAAALLAAQAVPGPAGPALAVAVLAVAASGALRSRAGRPLAAWVPVVVGWVARRSHGPVLAAEPQTARVGVAGSGFAGVSVVEVAGWPGHDALGLVRDRRSDMWAAVIPVRGQSFVLLDADDQVGRLEAWRAVLGTLARPGTPLRRIQWIHRSVPSAGGDLAAAGRPPAGGAGREAARESYQQLVTGAGLVTQSHQAWMVLAVAGPGRGGRGDRALDELRREVRLLDGHLRNADLRAGPPLGGAALGELLAGAHGGAPGGGGWPGRRPWPMATDEAWSMLRVDGTWHASYWVAEWPRVDVTPDFLTPLLLCDGRRTVAVVMAPVPADRAAREARAARAADVADEELRSQAGFLPSARRGREAEGVLRREAELAEGHAEYRFSGYVTVTAGDRDGLEAACVETEQAAQRAHLELRRLYGRQAEAYTWTLPLGRGLA
jgi:hypothetical protein